MEEEWLKLAASALPLSDYIKRLERVARIAMTIYMVSNNTKNRGITCPHGMAATYPTHAWWCDECFWELEEALAWVTPEILPKGKLEKDSEFAHLIKLLARRNIARDEKRDKLAYQLSCQLEAALKKAGYEHLPFPAQPRWQHPEKGGFWL